MTRTPWTRTASRPRRVRRLGAAALEFPLGFDDFADSRRLRLTAPDVDRRAEHRLPSAGSVFHGTWVWRTHHVVPDGGGHRAAGHVHSLPLRPLRRRAFTARERHQARLAAAPEVRSTTAGLAPLDAYVASAWPTLPLPRAGTAHTTTLLHPRLRAVLLPIGLGVRAGGRHVPIWIPFDPVGRMLAHMLRDRFDVSAAVAEFGCDTSVYKLTNASARRGVVFYARSDSARRGFELGVAALREFHERRPDLKIHLFGDPSVALPFPAINHGRLTPARLSDSTTNASRASRFRSPTCRSCPTR